MINQKYRGRLCDYRDFSSGDSNYWCRCQERISIVTFHAISTQGLSGPPLGSSMVVTLGIAPEPINIQSPVFRRHERTTNSNVYFLLTHATRGAWTSPGKDIRKNGKYIGSILNTTVSDISCRYYYPKQLRGRLIACPAIHLPVACTSGTKLHRLVMISPFPFVQPALFCQSNTRQESADAFAGPEALPGWESNRPLTTLPGSSTGRCTPSRALAVEKRSKRILIVRQEHYSVLIQHVDVLLAGDSASDVCATSGGGSRHGVRPPTAKRE